jgi:hypothetical protein
MDDIDTYFVYKLVIICLQVELSSLVVHWLFKHDNDIESAFSKTRGIL